VNESENAEYGDQDQSEENAVLKEIVDTENRKDAISNFEEQAKKMKIVSENKFTVGKIRDNMRFHVADVGARSDSAQSCLLYYCIRWSAVQSRYEDEDTGSNFHPNPV
jgi:hypothetical protein